MNKLYALALLGVLCVAPACDDDTHAGARAREETREAAKATKDYLYDQREEFQADMRRSLDNLEARSKELRKKAETASKDAADEMREAADKLDAKIADARDELAEAKNRTKDEWKDFSSKFKSRMDEIGDDIEDAFD